MKILHIIDSGGLYGAEKVLLELMTQQVQMGLKPILGSIGTPKDAEKPIETEARRRRLIVQSFRMRPGLNWAGAYRLLRFSWEAGIDIIHSHGYKGNILLGLLPCGFRRVPIVSTLHGRVWTGGLNRMMAYEVLDDLSLRFMDRVILVSEAMKAHSRLRRLSPEQVAVVENGISFDTSRPTLTVLKQEIVEFARKGFSIVAVGRLCPEKGYSILLEAVAALVREGRDVRLAILGQGGLKQELEQKTKDLRISDRVLFAGYVDDARNYLGLFRMFCMPSLTEGLPLVLLEAMAAGVPIAASRVGGIPRTLDHGRAGLLTKPEDVLDLRNAIASTMDDVGSAQHRARIGAERVRSLYSSRLMSEKYENIYRKVPLKSSHRAVLLKMSR